MTFLLKKSIEQGKDKENKGKSESGMVNLFLINAEDNYFVLKGFLFHSLLPFFTVASRVMVVKHSCSENNLFSQYSCW